MFVRAMRVLVLAHDFPPCQSPQAMRTAHLVDALRVRGHYVHVVCAEARGAGRSATEHGQARTNSLQVTYVSSDSIGTWIERAREMYWTVLRRSKPSATDLSAIPRLNWKGRLAQYLKTYAGALQFPGETRRWVREVRRELPALLLDSSPDCIVLCHEPLAAVLLHREASSSGAPIVLELGDPVLAPYTPKRWIRSAYRAERAACLAAQHIVVSCRATHALLIKRHGLASTKISVISQGFANSSKENAIRPRSSIGRPLRLVYTGRFYPFRDPSELLAALDSTDDVEFIIATSPTSFRTKYGDPLPRNVRIVGEVSHDTAVELQRSADVLVNIANRGLPQVPGKFYEYLGVGRPILHILHDQADEQALLLSRLCRGWSVANTSSEIRLTLKQLASLHRDGHLEQALRLDQDSVSQFSWSKLGAKFTSIVEQVAVKRLQERV